MGIKDYFSNHKKFAYPRLQSDAYYQRTIENFYEDFIRPHLKKLFYDNKTNLIQWCTVLEDYANSFLPIFWIRQFESGSGIANVNDNRRTGTTVLVDKNKTAIAAYSFISNFDAQELYNIILNVDPSVDSNEFKKLMLDGRYKFHYDNGANSAESAITSFECLAHANSFGVFNQASLYLAHIVDVNGEYASASQYKFESGNISDWKKISAYTGYDFLHIFANDPSKKIRVIEYTDSAADLNTFLKAHFFRFVHPFNYYLVPGQNYEINAVLGKTKRSIGEHQELTNYVRYRMYVDFIKGDADLEGHYATFESNVLIDDSQKISKNFISIEAACKPLANKIIHIIYGTSIGEEGQLIEKLSKKVVNTHELIDLYNIYTDGDAFVFRNIANGDLITYKPQALFSYVSLLRKLLQRSLDAKAMYEISLKKSAAGGLGKKAVSKNKKPGKGSFHTCSRDEILKMAVYYLKDASGLKAAEIRALGHSSNGSVAKRHLNKLGIDTATKSSHKGLLANLSIDDAIANASGSFKTTLEEIKKLRLL